MKKNFAVLPVLALGFAALAHSQAPAAAAPAAPAQRPGVVPTKIAIINAPGCIMQTKEGQKAFNELSAKFQPRKDAIDKKQASIQAMQDQLRKGAATLSPEAKQKLTNDINTTTTQVQRETEDASSEWDDAQGKIMQELGGKMQAVWSKYANENGYAVILDVGNQQTSNVLWAAQGVDISSEIIKLYDEAYPVTGTTTSAAPGTPPAGRAPATPPARTAPAPAGKKQ